MVMVNIHGDHSPWDAYLVIDAEGIPVFDYDPYLRSKILLEEKNAPCALRVLIVRQIQFTVTYGNLSTSRPA